jgi:RHS repeat-associated protein
MNDDTFGSGTDSNGDQPKAPRPGGQRASILGEVDQERKSPFVDKSTFAPELAVPKGGGAIRGMGEKFSADMFTGSAGMSAPIATSPGRGGFGPSLALTYSSGSGNGPFGHGWTLGQPAISRKTDRGLPLYHDHAESDVYIFAGAEDLVPELDQNGDRVVLESGDFVVHRYRPRTEGGFVRIERWYDRVQKRTHWRTISRDNVHSYFGRTASRNSTIHDPDNPGHVFRWLLDETRDDRGNIVIYEYKAEDLDGVNMGASAEANRSATTAQRYIKRIHYGNAAPSVASNWLFEVVFDYGEHGTDVNDELDISPSEDRAWSARPDAFSSFRSGFDIRTRRLCQRVLMFHRISDLDTDPYLVAATVFDHALDPRMARLDNVKHVAYEKNDQTGYFIPADFPELSFSYTEAAPASATKTLDASSLEGLPSTIDGEALRFVDLHGEGLPGILAEHGGAWFYKRNLGSGRFGRPEAVDKPTAATLFDGARLANLDGAGPKQLVVDAPLAGYFDRGEHVPERGAAVWGPYVRFEQTPTVDPHDPDAQRIDLAGDGLPDLVIVRGEYIEWYRSAGKKGFEAGRRVHLPGDERESPRLIFRDDARAVVFADMTGDGLSDLVCVSRAGVHYWPNRGYGRFGRRVAMAGVGVLDHPDQFSPARVKLADLDGTGPADLIYLGAEGCTIRYNQAGNGFAAAVKLDGFPPAHAAAAVDLVDLEGRGTACLVWSSALEANRGLQLRYIDLVGPQKPNLLIEVDNNRGLVTRTRYTSSTDFYLRDRLAGRPWATCLPYPVQVVDRVESHDQISKQKAVRYYAYHHGYHDAHEREFRGFGMVETWDTESFEAFKDSDASLFEFEYAPSNTVEEKLHQAPVHTKTWLHTGAFMGWDRVSAIFSSEYYDGDASAHHLPDTAWPSGLTPAELREAARALRGRTLRNEVYALDGDPIKEPHPYTVSEANFQILALQGRGPREHDHAVFYVHAQESLSYTYDRDPADPRIGHGFVLEVDEYGIALKSASLVYPRTVTTPHTEQTTHHITAAEVTVTHDTSDPDRLRLGVPLASKSFEVKGFSLPSGLVAFDDLKTAYDGATEVPYTDDDAPPANTVEKRLLGHSRVRYYADDLSGMLTEGQIGVRALPYDTLTRALDEVQFDAVFGTLTNAPTLTMMQNEGGYVYEAGQTSGTGSLWLTSGRAVLDATKFYVATSFIDPFGNTYSTTLDNHVLLPVSATDPLSNTVSVQNDYRLLTPWEVTDPNGNRSQVAFDTRGVVVKAAIMGKVGGSDGDTLADPTTTFEYDLFAFRDSGKPTNTKSRARITHGDPNTEWIESYSYFGGAGQTLMVKAQAEPGLAPQRDQYGELVLDQNGDLVLVDTNPDLRWIGNGRTILDNKGNPVRQYEPYYSSTHEYEDEAELVEQGVSPLIHYDAIGRVIRTDFPDGTFSKVEFTPWESTSWDANDTVEDSDWYAARKDYNGGDVYWQKERRAAELAFEHYETPSKMVFDSLGRPFLGIEDLGGGTTYETKVVLDIRGLPSQIIDARGNVAEGRTHGILGQVLETTSVDAGDRQALTTILGEPLRAWDVKDQCARVTYDELRRPVDGYVKPAVGSEILLSRVIYGESLASPQTTNHRGRVYRTYGGGGEATSPGFDFKGLPTSSELKLPLDPTAKNDWTVIANQNTIAAMANAAASSLETTVYTSSSTHDALGRVLTAISPDGSEVAYTYNERGALKTVDCQHRGSLTSTPVVADIEYDVRGRRESITYAANATTTTYGYDPQNFRLRSIETTRASDSKKLQGLHYHYDPVGNITDIRDDAQQTVYFQNAIVEAANSYEYDALYRLVEATGREHATQGTAQRSSTQLLPDSSPIPMANDPNALRRYTQSYTYDAVGNLETVVHAPASGTGWTRRYQYRTDGNRLVGTSAPGDTAGALYTNTATYSHTYPHDVHGNFTSMPHMSAMDWDELDQLHHCTVGTQDVYFQYAGGMRVRKYVEHSGGTTEERIYLGSFELYRKHVSGTLKEEWESLHISDDTGRIVLVETHTVDDGNTVGSPTGIWRFQLSNHLGSAATEVTETGAIISYEEYHPYGTSAYRLVDSQIDVPAKRYRYTGMERDEETGLGYHTARYYVPWLGRWSASDPIGIAAGTNRFAYVRGNPNRFGDPDGTEEVQHLEDPEVREIVVEKRDLLEEGERLIKGLTSSEGTQTHERTFRDRLAAVGQELHESIADKVAAAAYYAENPKDAAFDVASAYGNWLEATIQRPTEFVAQGLYSNIVAPALNVAVNVGEGVADLGTAVAEGDLSGAGEAYLSTAKSVWMLAAMVAGGLEIAAERRAIRAAENRLLIHLGDDFAAGAAHVGSGGGGGKELARIQRVEATGGPHTNQRLDIDPAGNVALRPPPKKKRSKSLFVGVDNLERAAHFLAKRIKQDPDAGNVVREFLVPRKVIERLTRNAQREAEGVKALRGRPTKVDNEPGQFGLHPDDAEELVQHAVPGSGRILTLDELLAELGRL